MRATPAVTVRLDAALVRDLRRAMCMEGDLAQSARNSLAVETAIRMYVDLKRDYLKAIGGRRPGDGAA